MEVHTAGSGPGNVDNFLVVLQCAFRMREHVCMENTASTGLLSIATVVTLPSKLVSWLDIHERQGLNLTCQHAVIHEL